MSLITWDKSDDIGVLTIDNGKQNKIKQADFLDLAALQKWISSKNPIGIIITGKGRHFSAGADLDYLRVLKNDIEKMTAVLKKGREILNYIQNLPIITVAAINGICFGAGLEIALSCQFRICAENAILAFPEANIGIMPGLTGTIRLPKLIGYNKALEIILSGRSVIAKEAKEIGLVDRVVSKKELLVDAKQFIMDLVASKTPQQVASIITAINNAREMDEESAGVEEAAIFVKLLNNLD